MSDCIILVKDQDQTVLVVNLTEGAPGAATPLAQGLGNSKMAAISQDAFTRELSKSNPSADENNRLKRGTDGSLFVAENQWTQKEW